MDGIMSAYNTNSTGFSKTLGIPRSYFKSQSSYNMQFLDQGMFFEGSPLQTMQFKE